MNKIMNTYNTRGMLQRLPSLRPCAAQAHAAKPHMPFVAMIPTVELRRLVATMVD